MFGLIIRIISVCAVSIFFITLLFSSFFQRSADINLFDIQSITSYSGSGLSASGGFIKSKEISLLESVFSSTQNAVSYTKEANNFMFDISQSGSYITSLRDLHTNYIFQGDFFQVLQKGVGEIYFDTERSPGKVFIFPLNTSLEIQLFGGNKEIYTQVFLSPHMYIEIDIAKIARLKNADALRVQTLYRLGYLAGNISQVYEEAIFEKYGITQGSFFQNTLLYIEKKDTHLVKYLSLLLEQEVVEMSGMERMQRYARFFINDEKKVIFYKNSILRGYIQLLREQKYVKENVETIQNDLNTLLGLDADQYKNMMEIQSDIIALLSASVQKEHILPKLSFALLTDPQFSQTKGYFSLYGNTLFRLYDEKKQFSPDLVKRFLQSFLGFVDGETEVRSDIYYQYFLFFLEKQLSFLLNYSVQTDQIEALIDTLKNYIDISNLSAGSALTSRITSLYIYDEILKDIDVFLRKQYFLEERTPTNLLLLSEKKLIAKDLIALSTQVERIFQLYDVFQKSLDVNDIRDSSISKDISHSRTQIREYLLALENYQAYTSQYDLSAKDFLPLPETQGQEGILDENTIRLFLSTFLGTNTSNLEVELSDGYYHIENLYISGKLFIFDLYPYSTYYRMKNIFIDGQEQRFAYNLENKSALTSIDGVQIPVSSDFFLKTFFATTYTTQVQDYIVEDKKIAEDRNIVVLKREVLLGDKGEFSSLRDFFPIAYDDIRVEKTGTGYNIFLQKAPLILKDISLYDVFLEGKYILHTTERYFQEVAVFLEYKNTETKVFAENKIKIVGNIPTQDMKTILGDISQNIDSSIELYTFLSSKYNMSTIEMQYSLSSQKMTFKFDSQGKKYTISFVGDTIDRFYIGTKSMIQNPTKIKNIGSYLP